MCGTARKNTFQAKLGKPATFRAADVQTGSPTALACAASEAGTIYRWMGLEELPIYLDGTLKSRTEAGGGSRRYKPFSLWLNAYASKRPASATVPVDKIRRALRPAAYTAVPWSVPSVDEKIDSRKHLAYAGETECRLRNGTRVPDGSFISGSYSQSSRGPPDIATCAR